MIFQDMSDMAPQFRHGFARRNLRAMMQRCRRLKLVDFKQRMSGFQQKLGILLGFNQQNLGLNHQRWVLSKDLPEDLLPTWCQKTRGIGKNPDFMRSLGPKKSPRLPHSKRPNPGWGGDRQAQWPERRFEAHRGSVGQTGFWVKSWDFILKCEGFERFNLQPSHMEDTPARPPILPKFAWLSWKKDHTRLRRTLSQTFLKICKKEVWLFEPRAAFSGQNRALEWSTALCSGRFALALGAHFDDLRRLEVGITLHGVSENGVPRKMTIIIGEMMIHMIRQCLDMISDSRSWHAW